MNPTIRGPISIELIRMQTFGICEKFLIFKYSENLFKLKFDNNVEIDGVETMLKNHAGIGDDVELVDAGGRKIQKGESVMEHETINLIKVNQNMVREECKIVNLKLEVYIDKLKIRMQMKCFSGWNKMGLMSHLGKMLGFKQGYFDFYTRNEISAFRSIFYHKNFEVIKAVYRINSDMDLSDRCINLESPRTKNLRQFRLRELKGYNFGTISED
jgi:hypothetical protein